MSRGLGSMQRLLLMHLAELEVPRAREAGGAAAGGRQAAIVQRSLAQLLGCVCAVDNAASRRIFANQRAEHERLREVVRIAGLSDKDCLDANQRERRDEARKYLQMHDHDGRGRCARTRDTRLQARPTPGP